MLVLLGCLFLVIGKPWFSIIPGVLFVVCVEYGKRQLENASTEAEAALSFRQQQFVDMTRMYLRIILSTRPADFQVVLDELQRTFADEPFMADVLSEARQLRDEA